MMPAREIMAFAAVGLINTSVGLSVMAVGEAVLKLGPYLSNMLAYAAGLMCSYVLNARWTFRAGPGPARRPFLFMIVFALAYAINLVLLHLLLKAGAPSLAAQPVALASYSLVFFVMCRRLVFRPRANSPAVSPSR